MFFFGSVLETEEKPLQPVCHCTQHLFINFFFFFHFCSVLSSLPARVILFSRQCLQRAKWVADFLILCLLELPGVLQGSRAESSFRPWSLSTGSVSLVAQVIWPPWTVYCDFPLSELRDSCHWLKVGGRQGYVSVQSVISIPFISPVIWWILLFYSP